MSIGLDYLQALWMRRKWVALLVLAGALAAVVSVTVSLPDLYHATTTVLVETQNVSEEFVRSSVSAELETRIETIRQEVMSRARLVDLITRLDLYPDLREHGATFDDIIARLRRDIQLEPTAVQQMSGRGRTIGFAISYSGRDPLSVARVTNELASFYVVANTQMREGLAMKTAEFLKTQLADAQAELDAQDQRLSAFNLSHIGELPEQVSANLAGLERLNTQLRLNGDNQVRANDRRERLERQMSDVESSAVGAPAGGAGTAPGDQLANLRRQLDELLRKYTDQYPEVIRVRTELAALERQLAERPVPAATTGTTTAPAAPATQKTRLLQAIGDIDTELKALKREELALRQAVSSYEQRVENVPKRQEEFQVLSRDYRATKDRHDALLKRYEEAQLAASLEQGQKVEQFRILDAAVPPRDPSAPDRLRFFVLGLILSIGLAVGATLVAEKIDTAFHSIDELQAFTTVPMLFSIPLILTSADTQRHWRRAALTAVSVAIGLALIVAGSRHFAVGNERIARVVAHGRA
jgi:polysaccharide chain length determinant protein (PEP-CTERM system associated)